jgi:TolB-like protein/Flp pilus assembly protein TadD
MPKLPAPLSACQPLLDLLLAKRPQDRLRDAGLLARRAEALQTGSMHAFAVKPRTPPAPAATVVRAADEKQQAAQSASAAATTVARAALPGRKPRRPSLLVAAAAIVVLAGVGGWRAWQVATDAPAAAKGATAQDDRSIAVLPLLNASGDESQQYFADGLSENLIVALSQLDGLRVISRNSAFQFRDGKEDSRTIGAKLGVAHLLEGSVQRAGDKVRVTATLVRSADGSTIWSQRYDRSYEDLFALEDDLSAAVAGALKAKLMPAGDAHPHGDRPPSGNLEAYAAYLRGRFHADRRTEADQREAIEQLLLATQLDHGYAEAWATLSRTWTGLTALALSGDAAQNAYAEARKAVENAIELAPDLASAHAARGYLLANADYDWQGAEAEYRRAIELAPTDDNAKSGLGRVLAAQGFVRAAVDLTRQVLANDPLYASQHYWQSIYLGALGRLDEAATSVRRAIELQSQAGTFHMQSTTIEIARGEPAEALAAAESAPPGIWRDVALALARAAGSDRSAADTAIQVVIDRHAAFAAYQIAGVYALRGDADQAFEWLDRALANRDPGITFLLYDPLLLTLRHDPRFAMFCHKVGLPPPERSEALGLGAKS